MLAMKTNTTLYPINIGNIDKLISLAKEVSYRMPSGLTREERKLWAKYVS